ncbi:hypothetical protein WG8_1764 [Paenibacillus sp. Aloe-11]|nr:hypothetical protein WG8_1764 [Paenibacillus sp. Aloe-11]
MIAYKFDPFAGFAGSSHNGSYKPPEQV